MKVSFKVAEVHILAHNKDANNELAGATIFVGDTQCAQIDPQIADGKWVIAKCNQGGAQGSQIKISTSGPKRYLTFCGIKVFVRIDPNDPDTSDLTKVIFNHHMKNREDRQAI